ncbi:MAG: hypothetical protein CMO81_04195 [Waddliaceae bacterium]|nr:hypothetical protein [Waddliaceae bacterium]
MQNLYTRLFVTVLSIFLLSACFSTSNRYMTQERYADIPLGAPVESLAKTVGEPFDITTLENGHKEYSYLERIQINRHMIEHREYILTISNNRVIQKRFEEEEEYLKDYMK